MTVLRALDQRFPAKRVFITGGASGLGLSLARLFAAGGWKIGLFDLNATRLTQLEGELSDAQVNVLAYPGDVTHAEELAVAVSSFALAHDGFDVMINSAGVAAAGNLVETELDDWRWIFEINFIGVLNGCFASVPHLQRKGTGLLINIASAAAFGSMPGMGAYNTTKAAVLSLSETLYGELRDDGIQVSVVMPTFFKTMLLENFRGPESGRAAAMQMMNSSVYTADDVARDIVKRAGNGDLYVVLPGSARWLWRLKRWMPNGFLRLVARARAARVTSVI
jgi:NADP-dependent 3-hydroxy acid dehydrogenase YdfG